MDRIVDGQLPDDAVTLGTIADGRQVYGFVAHPKVELVHRLHFRKLGEDERDRFLHAPVRALFDAVMADPEVSRRDGHEEFAAAGLLFDGFERALPKEGSSISLMEPFMPSSRRSLA
jgi:hypothetical protein